MTTIVFLQLFQAQDKEQSSSEGFTSSENDEELERELKRKARNKKVKMICVFDFIFTVDITIFFNLQKRFDTRDREDLVNDVDFDVDAEAGIAVERSKKSKTIRIYEEKASNSQKSNDCDDQSDSGSNSIIAPSETGDATPRAKVRIVIFVCKLP